MRQGCEGAETNQFINSFPHYKHTTYISKTLRMFLHIHVHIDSAVINPERSSCQICSAGQNMKSKSSNPFANIAYTQGKVIQLNTVVLQMLQCVCFRWLLFHASLTLDVQAEQRQCRSGAYAEREQLNCGLCTANTDEYHSFGDVFQVFSDNCLSCALICAACCDVTCI